MLLIDLRHALRSLLRRPGFLLMGVLALGLGLAGTTLVFSLVNTFLLREPPGMHPTAALLEVGRMSRGGDFDTFSYPDFVDVRRQAKSVDRVFAFQNAPAYLQRDGEAQMASAQLVSGDYFDALGVRAAAGRLLGPQHDAAPGATPVVVASHHAFERWFDSDDSRVGQSVTINGRDYTLIGVADEPFRGHEAAFVPDFYVPLAMAQAMNVHDDEIRDSRGSRWLRVGARLAPGADIDAARAELKGIAGQIEKAFPDSNEAISFDVAPLRPVPAAVWGMVAALCGALLTLCSAVVLLACFNLAGVMLARGQSRRAELAVRNALGAARGRIVRQLLIEAVVVGICAAFLALLLGLAGRSLLNALPLAFPVPLDLSLVVDWRVVGATTATAMAVSVLFGIWPALRLSEGARGGGSSLRESTESRAPRQRGRRLLVTAQAALTVCLLLFAALVLRAVEDVGSVDTGFRMQGVSLAGFDLEPLGIDAAGGAARMETLAQRLREQPGIEAAGFASVVPLTMTTMSFGGAFLPGQDGEGQDLDVNTVGEGFLETVGVSVRGRSILRSDDANAERVAVVNLSFAKRLFGSEDVLGRTFEMGGERHPVRVIGVMPDGSYSGLGESGRSFAYLAAPQWDRGEFTLFLRSNLPPADLRETLRREAQSEFPGLPAPRLSTFEAAARVSMLPQLMLGGAASALGALALILAATGLYGVLAFQVATRRREFGVRMAMGARGARIAGQVGRGMAWWVLPGVVLGLLMGQGMAVVAGEMMSGMGGVDVAATLAVLLVFALMALFAAGAPLARILRLRPNDALRSE